MSSVRWGIIVVPASCGVLHWLPQHCEFQPKLIRLHYLYSALKSFRNIRNSYLLPMCICKQVICMFRYVIDNVWPIYGWHIHMGKTRGTCARLQKSWIQALKIYLNWKCYFVIMFKMLEFPSSNNLVFEANCLVHRWVLGKNVLEMLKNKA